MTRPSLKRVPVTLSATDRETLDALAKAAGLPVASLAGLVLRRALEEVRYDEGLFFKVLVGLPGRQGDPAAVDEATKIALAGYDAPKPSLPVQRAPKPRGKRSGGQARVSKKRVVRKRGTR